MPIYGVDKPLGLTSHDVVARARRLLGTRKVGHAGTLDPLATGVLLVLVDEATKLSPYLTGHDKTYLAWVAFGAGTPTLDAEGPITERGDASTVDEAAVRRALPAFLDLSEQRPPAFSAIKQSGQRSYQAARRGEGEEPPPRPVGYRSISLLALGRSRSELPDEFAQTPPSSAWRARPGGRAFDLPARLDVDEPLPTALLELSVAAGTYVRAFARDLGTALGTPAHLSGLVRVASGHVDLNDTSELEELPDATPIAVTDALGLPTVELDEGEAVAVRHGKRPPVSVTTRSALVDGSGDLVALVEPGDGPATYDLLRVFN